MTLIVLGTDLRGARERFNSVSALRA
jgi:hypothetical protein